MSFLFTASAFLCHLGAWAGPASFSYQGQIIQPNGLALEASSVQFTVEVRSPAPNSCVLYRERHARNMSASNGIFSLQVGDGSRLTSADPADSLLLADALNKSAGAMTGLTCASGSSYTPDMNDDYELRVMFNDGSGVQVVAQNHKLSSVPYAMSAQSLDGVAASDLLQNRTDAGYVLDQANLESVFTSANYTELMALLGGTSSQYLSALPGAPFSMNSQRITDLADPTGATDAANKNYVDSYIGGSVANGAVLSTLGAGQAGQVLTWDGNEWTVSTPSMVDATKLPLAGGTMSGAINMDGNNILSAGSIASGSMSTTGVVTVGSTLNVTGNSTLSGDLSVVGQTSLDQDLLVSGGIGVTNGISSDNYIILNNENELRFGDSGSNYVGFKGPAAAAANIIWELPNSDGSNGQVLATDGFGNLSWIDPSLAAPVSSVYGRTGAVIAQVGDYNAGQVTNTPAGSIAATTVQTALNELDTEKANQSDLSALDTRVGSAETNITDLTTDLAATDAAAAVVEGRVTTAEGAITALDGRVTTNEGDITALQSDVGDLQTDVGTLTTGLASANTAITNLDTAKVNRAGDTMTGALNMGPVGTASGDGGRINLVELLANGTNSVGIRAPDAIGTSYLFTLPPTPGAPGQVLETDGSGTLSWRTLSAVGENNTASNVGAGGVGVFSSKSGVDLQFRNINAASNKISVTLDGGNNEIDLNLDEANFDSAAIPNTPAGGIAAANVQAAINELDTEKVAKAGDTMTGPLSLTDEVRFIAPGSFNFVGLRAPMGVGTDLIWELPATDGSGGQVLATDGSGALYWVSQPAAPPVDSVFGRTGTVVAQAGDYNAGQVTNTPAGSLAATNVQAALNELDTEKASQSALTALDTRVGTAETDINGLDSRLTTAEGTLTSLDGRVTATESDITTLETSVTALGTDKVARAGDAMTGPLTLNATNEVRFGDSDSSNYVGFAAPAIIGTNRIWTLPDTDGTSGQVLSTNGSGLLSWVDSATGAGDFMANGSVPMTGNLRLNNNWLSNDGGSEGIRIDDSGNVGIGIAAPGANLHVVGGSGALIQGTNTAGTAGNLTLLNTAGADTDRGATLQFRGGGLSMLSSITGAFTDNSGNRGYLAFSTFNFTLQERMRITSTGNIGVGTASPTTRLDVRGGAIMAGPRASASGNGGEVRFGELDLNGTNFVGFRAPDAIGADLIWTLPSADGTPGQVLQTDGGGNLSWTDRGGDGDFLANGSVPMTGNLRLNNNWLSNDGESEGIRIDDSGNVGIGTTTPSFRLDIDASTTTAAVRIIRSTGAIASNLVLQNAASTASNSGAGIMFSTGSFNAARIAGTGDGSSTTGTLQFSTKQSGALTEVMRMDSNGRVGIGTTNPIDTLHVADSGVQSDGTSGGFTIQQTDASRFGAGLSFDTTIDGGNIWGIFNTGSGASAPAGSLGFYHNNAYRVVVNSSGSVGIGVTNPARTLDVNGAIRGFAFDSTSSGNRQITIGSAGDGTYYNGLRIWSQYNTSQPSHIIGSDFQAAQYTYGRPRFDFIENVSGTSDIKLTISSGNVGIGNPNPRARLDVNGAIAAAPAVAEASDIVDFAGSNFAYTAGNCRALDLYNLKDGATYTLAIQGTGVGTCAFNAFSGAGTGALTVRMPPDHGPTENTKETLYSFVVIGTRVYVAWIPGY